MYKSVSQKLQIWKLNLREHVTYAIIVSLVAYVRALAQPLRASQEEAKMKVFLFRNVAQFIYARMRDKWKRFSHYYASVSTGDSNMFSTNSMWLALSSLKRSKN